MESGRLRNRVVIERPTRQKGRDGSVKRVYNPVTTVWASVVPLSAQEILEAQKVDARVTHRVRMRHRLNLGTHDRLSHLGRTLEPVSVIDVDERRRETEVLCREVVD